MFNPSLHAEKCDGTQENVVPRLSASLGTQGDIMSTKRCLFGPVNPAEVENMLKEEISSGKRRFLDKFGFDVDDLEKMFFEKKEIKRLVLKVAGKKPVESGASSRGVLKQYNRQLKVTDVFKQKKNSHGKNKDKEQ